MILTGTGFQPGAEVSFPGGEITVGSTTFLSSTSLQLNYVTVNFEITQGFHDITVTNPTWPPATFGGLFSVLAPAILSINPSTVSQGGFVSSMTITGLGLDVTGPDSTYFNVATNDGGSYATHGIIETISSTTRIVHNIQFLAVVPAGTYHVTMIDKNGVFVIGLNMLTVT